MNRKNFLQSSLLTAATALTETLKAFRNVIKRDRSLSETDFNLNYAPNFGMFRHHAGDDLIDQIKFMADVGFTALKDNGLMGRSLEMQKKIGEQLAKSGIQMGVFVIEKGGNAANSFTAGKQEHTEIFLKGCREAAEIFEPHGLVMVLEAPSDTPDLFLRISAQTYEICRAVSSPSCKILYDIYHMQRNEPDTGEINYQNVFKHIYGKGYKDILGIEHGESQSGKDGEKALLEAYVNADNFEV